MSAPTCSARTLQLESCHSTWTFDPAHRIFRRTVRGITMLAGSAVDTEWSSYFGLDLDWEHGSFVVWLSPDHTRLLRARRHTPSCALCGEGRVRGVRRHGDLGSD